MPELGDEHGQRGGGADPGQLLGHDGLGHHVGAGTAVSLGYSQGRQLQLNAGLERLPRELGGAVDLGGLGGDPLLGELPEGVTELALDVGQSEVGGFHPHILAEPIGDSHSRAPRPLLPQAMGGGSGRLLRGRVISKKPGSWAMT